MTREITHMKAFMIALESLGKDPLSIGQILPTPGVVDQFFNDSTGKGERGARDRLPRPLEPGQRLAICRGPRVSGPSEDTQDVVTSSRPRNLRDRTGGSASSSLSKNEIDPPSGDVFAYSIG